MTDSAPGADVLDAVLAGMRAREDELGRRLHDDLPDLLPSYRAVPRELLDQIWARHFQRALDVLRDGRVPPPHEIEEADVARDRAARGVPLSDGLRAFRRALCAIRDLFLAEATRHGLELPVVVDRTRALWELTDVESLRIASVHREAEVAAALVDARRRADFLRGLLLATLSAADIHSGAILYGLDPSRAYHAIRARGRSGADLDTVARRLERRARAHGRTGMTAVVDDAILGVAESRPEVGDLAVTAGLGPRTPLGLLHRSFATAGRLCDAATAYGLRGVYGLGDLSWRVAVVAEPDLTELLLDRHLRPLAAEGEFGALIEESLRAYLDTGRQIGMVARRLHVHVNTVRYRLRRYEELTGASLTAPDTLIELGWALAARDLRATSLD